VRGIDPGKALPPVPSGATTDATNSVRAASKPVAMTRPAMPAQTSATPRGSAMGAGASTVAFPVMTAPLKDAASEPAATTVLQPSAVAPTAAATTPASVATDSAAPLAQPAIGHPLIEPSARGFLQVASYGDRSNGERMLQRLQQAGIEHAELVSVQVNGQTLWRVHIGPYSADEAARIAERLDALGFGNPPFFKD